MTYLEKFKLEHPDENTNVALMRCPPDYGYESNDTGHRGCIHGPLTCKECWDREIPGTENTKIRKAGDAIMNMATALASVTKPDAPRILDSGNRREFESGAVRDIQEGKGRCDLLPLDVVGIVLERIPLSSACEVFTHINKFQNTGRGGHLVDALFSACIFEDIPTMLLEVAIHFEEGAKKYGDRNWQKGIPVRCYIDSAVRHYLKFLRGDKDEPHDRAFCWNILCALWTCKHKPELNDYAEPVEEKNG